MKWWVRCENLGCERFDRQSVARCRSGEPFLCPSCGWKCYLVAPWGDELGSNFDPGEDVYMHQPEVVQRSVTKILPRCEFNTRLHGTTPYPMRESRYWNTYSRSKQSRTTKTYDPKDVTKKKSAGGHYAKTGTYKNVFGFDSGHSKALSHSSKKPRFGKPQIERGSVYDAALRYRHESCQYILAQLAECEYEIYIAFQGNHYVGLRRR